MKNKNIEKKLKNCKIVSKVSQGLLMAGMLGLTAGLAWTFMTYPVTSTTELKEQIESAEAMQGYDEYVINSKDELYEKYKAGEITLSQFSKECRDMDEPAHMFEYARSLDDMEVQEILENQEKEINERDDAWWKIFGIAGGVSGAGLVGIYASMLKSGAYNKQKKCDYAGNSLMSKSSKEIANKVMEIDIENESEM